jgi:hypothetical protein
LLIEQLADNTTVSAQTAKAFIDIVGYFLQGYGVTCIPVDLRDFEADEYEYAIVNSLYPLGPQRTYFSQSCPSTKLYILR